MGVSLPPTAERLARSAASIDLVVAEAVDDLYEVGTQPQALAAALANSGQTANKAQVLADLKAEWAGDGGRFRYRVVQSLKGQGSKTFTLNGMRTSPELRRAQSSHDAVVQLRARLGSADLDTWPGFGACITPLYSAVGRRYLVFRDSHGRLLSQNVAVRYHDKVLETPGPVYVEVFGDTDPWLAAVRVALAPARR